VRITAERTGGIRHQNRKSTKGPGRLIDDAVELAVEEVPMSTTLPEQSDVERRVRRTGRRIGYVIAAVIDLVLLWVVHQLLDWGWPDFLTEDFDDLLPIISVSLVAGAIANAIYVWNDGAIVKNLGDAITSVIGLISAIWTYRVFPFDLSDGWALLARIVIIVGIVGTAIGAVVALVKLARGADPSDRGR
jgi:hypothetical protein